MDALSTELIIQILRFLDPVRLILCQLVCRRLYYIIQQSGELQYTLQLFAAGLEESYQNGRQLPIAERRRLLEAHEDAWRTASFGRVQKAASPGADTDTRYVINSRGKLFIAPDLAPIRFWSLDIPSTIPLPSDSEGPDNDSNSILELVGEYVELGEDESTHREYVVCIAYSEEQDLVVPIIFNGSPDSPELKFTIYQSSTLEPHPDAAHHEVILHCRPTTILYHELEQHVSDIQIVPADICGDVVVFTVPFTASNITDSEELKLDDLQTDCYCLWWKQGSIQTLRTFGHSLYSIVFLAPDLLLFLEPSKRRLEICKLTPLDPPATLGTVIFLGLPTPNDELHYHHFGKLRASPSVAVAKTSSDCTHTRYRSSPSAAIIAFQVYVQNDEDSIDTHLSFWESEISYICVLRHSDLVKFACPELADALNPSTLFDYPVTLPWQKWTKKVKYYWDQTSVNFPPVWTTHGYRLIVIRDGDDETDKYFLDILDFNPASVQRACHLYSLSPRPDSSASVHLPNRNLLRVIGEDAHSTGWFKDTQESTMAHLRITSKQHDLKQYHPQQYDDLQYDDLLVDDDKIICADRTTSRILDGISRTTLDILHLG